MATVVTATATGCLFVPIELVPLEPEEEDEYADFPIYERIQLLLLDYYVELALLQL
jgi:hypothetical protein